MNIDSTCAAIIKNIGIPKVGQEVSKIEARTGTTTGMVYAPDFRDRTDVLPEYTAPKKIFRDWKVISDQYGLPFSLAGDSGSGVVNNEHIIGQIHSGIDEGGRVIRITFMAAFETVIEDLQRRIPGCFLTLPSGSRLWEESLGNCAIL